VTSNVPLGVYDTLHVFDLVCVNERCPRLLETGEPFTWQADGELLTGRWPYLTDAGRLLCEHCGTEGEVQ